MAYKRVLLKISGEQLAGKYDFGIDPEIASYLAEEIKKVIKTKCEIVLVLGGGNMVRGEEVAGKGIKRVTADQMGMLSGLINSMCLTDIFEYNDISVRCLSNIYAEQVCEPYSFRRAEKHLDNGHVLIVAAGIGRPYFTHDTAGVSIALELGCDVMLKASKVEGVYDKDPKKFKDAIKYDKLSFKEALGNDAISVIDKAALGLAMEHKLPIVVFDLMKKDDIVRACKGEKIGTAIS